MQLLPIPVPLWPVFVALVRGAGGGGGGAGGMNLTSLFQNSTTVGNTADTNEDTLHTYTMPGGTLAVDGDAVLLISLVKNAATGNGKQTRVRFGGTLIGDSTALAASDNWWAIHALITRTSATAQKALCWVSNVANNGAWNNGAGGALNATTPAETLSGAVTIVVTGQSTAAAVANDIQAFMTTIFKIPAP